MTKSVVSATLTAAFASLLCVTRASADDMFRGDARHSGVYSAVPGSHYAGLQWRVQTGGAVRSSPAVYKGTVYVGSSDGNLYAIAIDTGKIRWTYAAGVAMTSSPAVDEAHVMVAARDGTLRVLNRADGKIAWEQRAEEAVPLAWGHESADYWAPSPTIAEGTVYVGARDGMVYALDEASGNERWRARTGGRVMSAPAVAGDSVFVGSYDGYVYALARRDGALLWKFATDGSTLRSSSYGYDRRSIQSSPAVGDGAVYVGAKDGAIYAIEMSTGKLRWRHAAEVYWYMSSPAFDRGIVVTGNSDGRFVQALSARNGHVVWQFDTHINVFASPSIAGGVVYTGAWDGKMYALDETSGREMWSFKTLGRRIFSSARAEGSRLYFGADDGGIYALNTSASHGLRLAVFYDGTLAPFNDLQGSTSLRDYLIARGYVRLDAAHLRSFLIDPANGNGASAVAFAMTALPQDVIRGDRPLLRQYLERGGKVVWCGRPPLLWGTKTLEQRTLSDLDRSRPRALLGISYERGNFDPMTAHVTPGGLPWGLAGSWLSNWSADPDSVTTVLAADEQGLAAAWVRNYGGPSGTGFVQIPLVVSPQGVAENMFAIDMASQYSPIPSARRGT